MHGYLPDSADAMCFGILLNHMHNLLEGLSFLQLMKYILSV